MNAITVNEFLDLPVAVSVTTVCATCKRFDSTLPKVVCAQYCQKKGAFVRAWTCACEHYEEEQ